MLRAAWRPLFIAFDVSQFYRFNFAHHQHALLLQGNFYYIMQSFKLLQNIKYMRIISKTKTFSCFTSLFHIEINMTFWKLPQIERLENSMLMQPSGINFNI